MLSDAELVRAAQEGDATSLGILLERHRAPLQALAFCILGHGSEAQDAVQDAFLVALRKIDQLREPEAVGGWLRAVLRNACLMRVRKRRSEVFPGEVTQSVERGSVESSAEAAIDRLAMREWVWTALSELPEALRATAMLRYFGSYSSYEEVSAILGVPVGTVKRRLNEARNKLADALLKTAGLAHDEAGRLTQSQTRFFEAAYEQYNRGQGYELLASAFSKDLLTAIRKGTDHRGQGLSLHYGRKFLDKEFRSDLEAGTKVHITNVLASKDVTIVEGDNENPPDKPFRCPPSISMVCFYHDVGRIERLHVYEAPRPTVSER